MKILPTLSGILFSLSFPSLHVREGVENEGWFDSWMLLGAFRKKMKSMGVEFLEADVTGVTARENRVERVKVSNNQSFITPNGS